jgi:hypothetical protein
MPPGCQHPDNGDDRQGQGQQSGDIRDKHPGGIFALLAFILAAPWVITITAPGFADTADKFALTTQLLRITFPYITVTIARARVSNPETYETNTRVASSPCLLLYSARIGTRDAGGAVGDHHHRPRVC